MQFRDWHIAALLGPIFVAACASGPPPEQELGDRLQTQLTPELAGGQAGLVRLPDGAQVTLTEDALFPRGSAELDARGRYILASVIEGLLEPTLLRIDVAGAPASLQQARAHAVMQFMADFQLAPELQAAPPGQTLAITVRVNPTWQG